MTVGDSAAGAGDSSVNVDDKVVNEGLEVTVDSPGFGSAALIVN